jgi:hypothetical protein
MDSQLGLKRRISAAAIASEVKRERLQQLDAPQVS